MSSPHPPFLSVPREIRDQIYGYLLVSDIYATLGGSGPEATLEITSVCTDLDYETTTYLKIATISELDYVPREASRVNWIEEFGLKEADAKLEEPWTDASFDLTKFRQEIDWIWESPEIPVNRARYYVDEVLWRDPWQRGRPYHEVVIPLKTSYEKLKGALHPGILRINRQIRDEAEQVIYSKSTFRFS